MRDSSSMYLASIKETLLGITDVLVDINKTLQNANTTMQALIQSSPGVESDPGLCEEVMPEIEEKIHAFFRGSSVDGALPSALSFLVGMAEYAEEVEEVWQGMVNRGELVLDGGMLYVSKDHHDHKERSGDSTGDRPAHTIDQD